MRGLADVLGQKEIINAILTKFSKEIDDPILAIIRGNSGTGKSHIANQLVNQWLNKADSNQALLLDGDLSQNERAFYPFNIGLIKAKTSLFKRDKLKKGAAELVKGIPYAGDFIGFLLEMLENNKANKDKYQLSFLQPEEYEIVVSINSLYKHSELLLIADNFHWWDDASITLLTLLLSEKLSNVFPFLKKLRVLIVVTDDQFKLSNPVLNNFLGDYTENIFCVKKLKQSDFKSVLLHFGDIVLNPEMEGLIYSLTDGHLELIKNIFQYLSIESGQSLDAIFNSLDPDSPRLHKQFLEKIFTLRLQQLGVEAEQIISILEFASIIGLHFTFEEILCLTKEEEEKLKHIIQKARESHLLNNESLHIGFSHEIIREFFFTRIEKGKSNYYKSFAYCLALLRPSEYFQRANLLFESGIISEALNIYVVGYLKYLRDGLNVPLQIEKRINELVSDYQLDTFYYPMREAYTLFFEGKYDKAKFVIWNIEDIYSEILLAEKYYLLSLCLAKNLNKQDLIESRNCLLNWDSLKNHESELWVRIMLTLISRHAHLSEYYIASAIERKIMMFLSERVLFDPFAEYGINVLRRKASILHISEIAVKRTEASLEYFGKTDLPGVYNFPIQYYMALANHSGNLITAGEFYSGHIIARQALLFKESIPEISFPRIEVPINNFIVSGYLSNEVSIEKCVELFESLLSNIENPDTRILLQNNYIILKALSGNLEQALVLINQLHALLASSTREDNYYDYFIGINRFAINILCGKRKIAIKIITELKLKIPQIPDKHYLERRHDLMQKLYRDFKSDDPKSWSNLLFERHPQELGMSWRLFGNGFLFTDMQFWSDS